MHDNANPPAVEKPGPAGRTLVGIDAAITARHHVAIADSAGEMSTRFKVEPTLAGLRTLTDKLSGYDDVHATVEPTSMTWLQLTIAVEKAGGTMHMVGARHSAPLRGAIVGKSKSDIIDADVLTRAGQVFDLKPLILPTPQQLALRRSVIRRAAAVIDPNRSWRRLMSLARWAFPDVWTAFAGSLPTATAILQRWPDIRALASARRATLTAVVAAHTRGAGDTPARAEAIKVAAAGWAAFWEGYLDLDATEAISAGRYERTGSRGAQCNARHAKTVGTTSGAKLRAEHGRALGADVVPRARWVTLSRLTRWAWSKDGLGERFLSRKADHQDRPGPESKEQRWTRRVATRRAKSCN
ncbi:IS110 family transposase [Mycolicibacter algericus]|uniref:Transposase IS110-like N-terminal domain-containing protein n=2 Tax=Mycolicibacter algericus TaxID=1288388 RepID=A0A7I9YAR6_MYCAL|nr:transposase [Mycolicibacter algericus]GFG85592.1 hypothetical protein MALGJ_22680 [Mycolicibacter algericus]